MQFILAAFPRWQVQQITQRQFLHLGVGHRHDRFFHPVDFDQVDNTAQKQ